MSLLLLRDSNKDQNTLSKIKGSLSPYLSVQRAGMRENFQRRAGSSTRLRCSDSQSLVLFHDLDCQCNLY